MFTQPLLLHAVLSDPGETARLLPDIVSGGVAFWSGKLHRLSRITLLTGLNHFNLSAYGL